MTNKDTPEEKAPVSLEQLKADFESIMQLRDEQERAKRWEAFEKQLQGLQASLSDQYNDGLELLKQRYATFQKQGFGATSSEVAGDALKVGGNVLAKAGDLVASQAAQFQKSGELLARDVTTIFDEKADRNDRIASGTRLGIVGAGVFLLSRWLLKKDPDVAQEKEKKGFFRKVAGGFWTALKAIGVFSLASRAVNYFGPAEEKSAQKPKEDVPSAAPAQKEPVPVVPPIKDPSSVALAPRQEAPSVIAPKTEPKITEPSVVADKEKDGWQFGRHTMRLVQKGGQKFLSVDRRVFQTRIVIGYVIKKDVSDRIMDVERTGDGGLRIRYLGLGKKEAFVDVSQAECAKIAEALSKAKAPVSLTVQTKENGKDAERSFECSPE